MLDYKTRLVIIWWLISITTTILFIRTILKKQTIPHLYSQIIWVITVTIWLLWQIYDDAWVWTWILFFVDCWVVSVLILSLKYWIKDPTKWDKIVLALALISIIPRILTKTPLYSVILVTFIDTLWYFPILNKIRRYPNSEALYPRIIWNTSFIAGVLGLNHISILSALYITVSFCMNTLVILAIIYFKKAKLWTLSTK
jgi:hypothetical protein